MYQTEARGAILRDSEMLDAEGDLVGQFERYNPETEVRL